ncbi:MAG: 4Fe-4S dicluster domain-containing protein [Phycisphaerae bacterium]|nr:4Fe-4S dicluster domain-containing protein [Gemmatimonadaceae bacterium]
MTTLPARACALPDSPLAHAAAGLDACVHCGFCLQACPTYVNLQDENDSPRGRLVLMRRLLEGDVAIDDPDVGTHMDRCLGCRACETACPSGVPYGHLLEATRATTAVARGTPLVARIVLTVFANRSLLTVALFGARIFRATGLPRLLANILPKRLAFPMAMLASTAPKKFVTTRGSAAASSSVELPRTSRQSTGSAKDTSAIPARSKERVAVLEGCVMRGLFAHTNAATERVLEANGFSMCETGSQSCCGALHAHAGDLDTARALARKNIAAFEGSDASYIAINSAGCGAMIKEYAHLLRDDAAWHKRAVDVSAKARDISELLVHGGAASAMHTGASLPLRVTYDAPCHLMHAQRVTTPPLTVLSSIPGMQLVPLTDADQCCGSAGIYNLIEPDTSDAVLAPKLARIAESQAAYVATGNPGCLMQIGAGLMLSGSQARAVHPVDLLDASYAGRAPV